MARKAKSPFQRKLDEYYSKYELEDDKPNDKISLSQLILIELQMERIQQALSKIENIQESAGDLKKLTDSYKNLSQQFVSLQAELGISRRKRQSEDEETPFTYVQRLQEQAVKFLS